MKRAAESYTFGTQPRVQKGHLKEGGRPRDVKTQAQVSKETNETVTGGGGKVEEGGEPSGERKSDGGGRG